MPRIRTHPGEILNEEFLKPLNMSATKLAKEIDVPANRLTDIIRGRRSVTADTAIRLGRHFGTTPQFWLNMQAAHDLSVAHDKHDYSQIRRRRGTSEKAVKKRLGCLHRPSKTQSNGVLTDPQGLATDRSGGRSFTDAR